MRLAALVSGITSVAVLGGWKAPAHAQPNPPPRPHGEAQIRATFGAACNGNANAHATTWPRGAWDGSGRAVTVRNHSRLAKPVNTARWMVSAFDQEGALHYGIGGYNCRRKSGGSSAWSTHAWGIAVDTNTLCNPQGRSTWNGAGYNGPGRCDGRNWGDAIPKIWKTNNDLFYVNFAWGISWNDPHHFQYATGY